LERRPDLIKTSLDEFSKTVGPAAGMAPGRHFGGAASLARALQAKGARDVLVSLGAEGALLAAHGGDVLAASSPESADRDLFGAGDALLAGFLAGRARGLGLAESLRLGAAAGAAAPFSAGLALGPAVAAFAAQIEVAALDGVDWGG
jgi:1-phosphofructokinase